MFFCYVVYPENYFTMEGEVLRLLIGSFFSVSKSLTTAAATNVKHGNDDSCRLLVKIILHLVSKWETNDDRGTQSKIVDCVM
jgi:hypothetical protein